ncbi:hypothetical protein [Phytohabitans rumicis]|uniref:Transposase (putative) YhgA-like domain-containing protein n=1 Tax=Phytohabitans rumicis TaxID=1076125 RepID=A0A6V8L5V7_9ACTN|nr:hypothetical protein [Phytohabitans rumicis]GFJ92633.1 hypothetical protein Prum_062750 [Phytohabitans rumicis]
MLLFCDPADRPLLAVVLEVQRRWDDSKRRTWKLYVAQLEAELDVNAALLVYCPDRRTAGRYRDLFEFDGLCLTLRPFIFTPDDVPLVVDVDQARANPALTVLSAICHGSHADIDTAFPALGAALHSLGPRNAILYYDVVLAGLPVATRTRWEAFMTTIANYEFRSELLRVIAAENRKIGEARAVLTVLEGRGVPVPEDTRERILACTDPAQLNTWLLRAGTATSIDDVTRG